MPHTPAAVRKAIVDMYLDGLTVKQISSITHMRHEYVYHLLQDDLLTCADRGRNVMARWRAKYATII